MANNTVRILDAVVVEEQVVFTLHELCRASGSDEATLLALVHEGVLEPAGEARPDWRFSGAALRQARKAQRLANGLELGPAAAALVLELLAEIDALRGRLNRAGLD